MGLLLLYQLIKLYVIVPTTFVFVKRYSRQIFYWFKSLKCPYYNKFFLHYKQNMSMVLLLQSSFTSKLVNASFRFHYMIIINPRFRVKPVFKNPYLIKCILFCTNPSCSRLQKSCNIFFFSSDNSSTYIIKNSAA